MRLLQSILGGILGSALGVASYYGIMNAMRQPVPWAVVVIGLLTGLGVRLACQKNRSGMTGIIAATLALVGLLGFNYAQIAMARQGSGPIVVDANSPASEVDAEPDRPSDDAGVEDIQTPDPEERIGPAPVTVGDVVSKPNLALAQTSPVDTIAMVLSGLLAYLLGRGSAPKLAPTTSENAEVTAAPTV